MTEKSVKRSRRVEADYNYYDPPGKILEKILTGDARKLYRHPSDEYEARDRAFPAFLYLTTCRVSEPLPAVLYEHKTREGYTKQERPRVPGVRPENFELTETTLKLRWLPIVKRFGMMEGGDYPTRGEITMTRIGELKPLTELIIRHLEQTPAGQPLWGFGRKWGYMIVRSLTGETDHYFRAMGLKFYSRLLDRNLINLQQFSGHKRLESLMKYLGEGAVENKLPDAKLW